MRPADTLRSGLRLGSEFLAWWLAELAALRPAWLARLAENRRRRLLLRRDGEGYVAVVEQGASSRLLTVVTPAALRQEADAADAVILVLPPESVLRRSVELPALDNGQLSQLVPNELDRFTPFAATEAWFDWRVVSRHPETNRVVVEIAVSEAAQATASLQHASATGVIPDKMMVEGDLGLASLDLLRWQGRRNTRRLLPRFSAVALALIAVGLGVALFTAWDMREEEALLELRQSAQTLRPAAEAGDRQRRELSTLRERAAFLAAAQAQRPVLEDIAALTRALPDTAWLYSLQISVSRIQMGGQAQDASALIQRIEAESGLRNAQFRQPVTKVGSNGLDRFEIGIERAVAEMR